MSFVTFQQPACEVCDEPATNKIDGAYLCAHHAAIYDYVESGFMEKYNIYIGVFNSHPQDHRAGVKAVNAQFGKGAYAAHVAPIIKAGNGVMAIFKQSPTPYTQAYAEAVTESVNKRRGA